MSDLVHPTMSMLFKYTRYFCKLYEEAGIPNANERIRRHVNMWSADEYFERQVIHHERERLRFCDILDKDKKPDGEKLSKQDRVRYYKARGRSKKARDQNQALITNGERIQAFLNSLPAVPFNLVEALFFEAESKHGFDPQRAQRQNRRHGVRFRKRINKLRRSY